MRVDSPSNNHPPNLVVENGGMFRDSQTLYNSRDELIPVWFEPWGMRHDLPPSKAFRIDAESEQDGRLEITEETSGAAVYAWPGCTMKVYLDDDLVDDFSIAFPDALPPGMSTRRFIDFFFGGPGGPNRDR